MNENRIFNVLLITIILMGIGTGCAQVTTRKLTLTQFQSGEIITGIANLMTRKVTVTMPNGEILEGKFSEQSDFSVQSNGQAYALLKSSSTKLMLELKVTFNEYGQGFGDAHTNEGKDYKVQF